MQEGREESVILDPSVSRNKDTSGQAAVVSDSPAVVVDVAVPAPEAELAQPVSLGGDEEDNDAIATPPLEDEGEGDRATTSVHPFAMLRWCECHFHYTATQNCPMQRSIQPVVTRNCQLDICDCCL